MEETKELIAWYTFPKYFSKSCHGMWNGSSVSQAHAGQLSIRTVACRRNGLKLQGVSVVSTGWLYFKLPCQCGDTAHSVLSQEKGAGRGGLNFLRSHAIVPMSIWLLYPWEAWNSQTISADTTEECASRKSIRSLWCPLFIVLNSWGL